MSVILDALRKAEGERELAYVPTPTSMHGEPADTGRRALPWILACALLMGAAGVLLVRLGPPIMVGRPSTDAQPRAINSRAGDGASTPPEQPSQRDIQHSSSLSNEKAPDAAVTNSRELADATVLGPLRARVPVPDRAARVLGPRQTEARQAGPRAQGAVRAQNARPHVAASEPATTAVPVPPPIVPPLAGNAEGLADPTPPPAQSASIPRTGTAPSQVQEALAEMTLNVLVYSEDAAERWVFIGGRRYVEGERVDGRFLVQEIRPEGVLLNRQGEQALLRLPGRSK